LLLLLLRLLLMMLLLLRLLLLLLLLRGIKPKGTRSLGRIPRTTCPAYLAVCRAINPPSVDGYLDWQESTLLN
jgi:hypothetical protein